MKLFNLHEDGHWETIGDYPGSLIKKKRDKNNLSFIVDNESKENFKKHLKLENLEDFKIKQNTKQFVTNIKNTEEHQNEVEILKDKANFRKEIDSYNDESYEALNKNKAQRHLSKVMLIIDRVFNKLKNESLNIECTKHITNNEAKLTIKAKQIDINIELSSNKDSLQVKATDKNNNKIIDRNYIIDVTKPENLFNKISKLIELTLAKNFNESLIIIRETEALLKTKQIESQSKIEPKSCEFYLNFKDKDMATLTFIQESTYKWALFVHNLMNNNEHPITTMIESNSLQSFAKAVKINLMKIKRFL